MKSVLVRRYTRRRQTDPFHARQVRRYGPVPTRLSNATRELRAKGYHVTVRHDSVSGWIALVQPPMGAFVTNTVREVADRKHLRVGFDYFTPGHERAILEMPSEDYLKFRGWLK